MSLEASGASVRLGGRLVVDGVDLLVRPGTVTALIGPNGAGKSSLIRTLAGTQRADAGRITIDDRDLSRIPRRERARLVSLVEQDATTELSLPVRDVVALGRTPHAGLLSGESGDDLAAIDDAMRQTGVGRFATRDYSTLSGGERQRVQLARALAQQGELLLLDEPTNHLDVSAQLETLALLRTLAANGIGVLSALHDLNLAASFADTVVVLLDGRVVAAGAPREVLTAETIGRVYGVTATVLEHPVTGAPLIAFSSSSEPPIAD